MLGWYVSDFRLSYNEEGHAVSGKLICKGNRAELIEAAVQCALNEIPGHFIKSDESSMQYAADGDTIIIRTVIYEGSFAKDVQ